MRFGNKVAYGMAVLLMAGGLACTQYDSNSAEIEEQVERSLEAQGLRDITVDRDEERGILTLSGEVATEGDKMRAEQIARETSNQQMVANEIAVRPPGMQDAAEDAQSAMDDAIENSFEAELARNQLETGIDYDSEQGVLTLSGEVDSQATRQQLESLASSVPNVKQVVNEIEIEGAASRP
jgi:hyperosmotically inducible protein